MDPFTSVSCLRFFTSSGQFQSAPLPFNLSTRVRVIYRISNTTLLFLTHAIHDSHPSTVPWLEPNGRWEHPCGRGDGGLSRHLYLHALQCPGFHGMVPSRSPGAKGTFTVTVHLKVHPGGCRRFFFFTHLFWLSHPGQDPPKFSVVPGGEYRQEAGRELVIPCEAEGDPFPNITWRKVRPPVCVSFGCQTLCF